MVVSASDSDGKKMGEDVRMGESWRWGGERYKRMDECLQCLKRVG